MTSTIPSGTSNPIRDLTNQFKQLLAEREANASDVILTHYGTAWRSIYKQLTDLTAAVEEAKRSGTEVSPSWLYNQTRYRSLLKGIRETIAHFADAAHEETRQAQADAVHAGYSDSNALIAARMGPPPESATPADVAKITTAFGDVPSKVIDTTLGNIQSDNAVGQLFDSFGETAAAEAKSALVDAVIQGKNGREIAGSVQDALGTTQARAETIARTELNRSYRQATYDNYQANSDVVNGYVWIADLSTNTCGECWAMNGQVFEFGEEPDSHPNCRCAIAPMTQSWADLGFDMGDEADYENEDIPTGEDVFAQLPEQQQAKILGPSKNALYQTGQLKLPDLIGYKHDATWGGMRYEKSLTELGFTPRDVGRALQQVEQGKAVRAHPLVRDYVDLIGGEIPPEVARALRQLAEAFPDAMDTLRAQLPGTTGLTLEEAQKRQDEAQATYDKLRLELGAKKIIDLPPHPTMISDFKGFDGQPLIGAIPSKVFSGMSEYLEVRAAILKLWDAQALADAAATGQLPAEAHAKVLLKLLDAFAQEHPEQAATKDMKALRAELLAQGGQVRAIKAKAGTGEPTSTPVRRPRATKAAATVKPPAEVKPAPLEARIRDALANPAKTTLTTLRALAAEAGVTPGRTKALTVEALRARHEGPATPTPAEAPKPAEPSAAGPLTRADLAKLPLSQLKAMAQRMQAESAPGTKPETWARKAALVDYIAGVQEGTITKGAAPTIEEQHASTEALTQSQLEQIVQARQTFTDPNTGRTAFFTAELNGKRYFIRPGYFDGVSRAEVVTSLAERVGLGEHYVTAQTVQVDGKWYEVQRYLEGHQYATVEDADNKLRDQLSTNKYLSADERMKISLFSSLIGDYDRYANNMWLTPEGKLVQIDYDVFSPSMFPPGGDLLERAHLTYDEYVAQQARLDAMRPSRAVMKWMRDTLLSPQMQNELMRAVRAVGGEEGATQSQYARIQAYREYAALKGTPPLGEIRRLLGEPHIREMLRPDFEPPKEPPADIRAFARPSERPAPDYEAQRADVTKRLQAMQDVLARKQAELATIRQQRDAAWKALTDHFGANGALIITPDITAQPGYQRLRAEYDNYAVAEQAAQHDFLLAQRDANQVSYELNAVAIKEAADAITIDRATLAQAKTTPELVQWLKGSIPQADWKFGGNPNPAVMRAAVEQWATLAEHYPEAMASLRFVGLTTDGTIDPAIKTFIGGAKQGDAWGGSTFRFSSVPGYAGMDGAGIVLPGADWRDPTNWLKEAKVAVQTGDWQPGAVEGGQAYIITHEFGHVLEYYAAHSPDPTVRAKYNALLSTLNGDRANAFDDYAKYNAHEYFAEAFAALYYGPDSLRQLPMVQAVRAFLDDLFNTPPEANP